MRLVNTLTLDSGESVLILNLLLAQHSRARTSERLLVELPCAVRRLENPWSLFTKTNSKLHHNPSFLDTSSGLEWVPAFSRSQLFFRWTALGAVQRRSLRAYGEDGLCAWGLLVVKLRSASINQKTDWQFTDWWKKIWRNVKTCVCVYVCIYLLYMYI